MRVPPPQSAELGDWYGVLVITAFNAADLAGKLLGPAHLVAPDHDDALASLPDSASPAAPSAAGPVAQARGGVPPSSSFARLVGAPLLPAGMPPGGPPQDAAGARRFPAADGAERREERDDDHHDDEEDEEPSARLLPSSAREVAAPAHGGQQQQQGGRGGHRGAAWLLHVSVARGVVLLGVFVLAAGYGAPAWVIFAATVALGATNGCVRRPSCACSGEAWPPGAAWVCCLPG